MDRRPNLGARCFLCLVGVTYLGLALWCTFAPAQTAEIVGFHLVGGSGTSEFVTVYGGLEFGMALIFLAPLIYPAFLKPAMTCCLLLHGSLVLFRAIGFATLDGIQTQTYKLAAGEWAIFMLSAVLLFLLASRRPGGRHGGFRADWVAAGVTARYIGGLFVAVPIPLRVTLRHVSAHHRMPEISSQLSFVMAITIVIYVGVMYGISFWAQRRIHDEEDFLVAGRQLPLSLAWMTLLATWFGAATMITVAEEVREVGVRAAGLDPLGAGVCLLLAGLFLAGPMWRLKILTIPDLFRQRFGRAAETTASLIMIPSYFGWIAAQFTALAAMMSLFFDLPVPLGIVLVAVVGAGYTMLGGMWSVTLTDAIQVTLLLMGLVVLLIAVLAKLGGGVVTEGWRVLADQTEPALWHVIPQDDHAAVANWLGLFVAGAIGNLAAQDLMQRVFSSRSERIARRACLIAGSAYLVFGTIPVLLGLAARHLFPQSVDLPIIPALASLFLHPVLAVIFVIALLSAVLSTIDSALLSPAAILSHNLLARVQWPSRLALNRLSVAAIAAASAALAIYGEDAYALLEASYEMTLVGLVVPMLGALYLRRRSPIAALASMWVGVGIWAGHLLAGWDVFLQPYGWLAERSVPPGLAATLAAAVVFLSVTRFAGDNAPADHQP